MIFGAACEKRAQGISIVRYLFYLGGHAHFQSAGFSRFLVRLYCMSDSSAFYDRILLCFIVFKARLKLGLLTRGLEIGLASVLCSACASGLMLRFRIIVKLGRERLPPFWTILSFSPSHAIKGSGL